jgi:hypothetical protein
MMSFNDFLVPGVVDVKHHRANLLPVLVVPHSTQTTIQTITMKILTAFVAFLSATSAFTSPAFLGKPLATGYVFIDGRQEWHHDVPTTT